MAPLAAMPPVIAYSPMTPSSFKRALAVLGVTSEAKPRAAGALDDSAAPTDTPLPVDRALARAALLVARGDASGASQLVSTALSAAAAGNAGWLVPVEPLLRVQHARQAWAPVLAQLRTRAA